MILICFQITFIFLIANISYNRTTCCSAHATFTINNMRKKCRGKSYNLIPFYIYIPAEGVAYELNALPRTCIR